MKKKLGRKFYKKLGEFVQIATDCTITKEDGRLVRVDMTLSGGSGRVSYADTKWLVEKLRQNHIDFNIEIMRENVPKIGSAPFQTLVASQFERDMMQDFINRHSVN